MSTDLQMACTNSGEASKLLLLDVPLLKYVLTVSNFHSKAIHEIYWSYNEKADKENFLIWIYFQMPC